jgi:GDP/UDP-N,N'-diacetylbacillosamine 2-epimerase (hydrolysing)
MNRKICVVTGTRAEYGLLRWVMQGIRDDPELTLQVIVTGMHLSPEFGLTYENIEEDGFKIDRKLEILTSSDTPVGISKSMGLGLIGFADALNELKPDLIVVLGDRFEIFSAVTSALVARIPVAHLHGGETTEGVFDEALRHSITKMSHLHFVATPEYQQRVIQLGEQPKNVFMVGGLGIDAIQHLELMNQNSLEADLGFKFNKKNLLITFHPVTLENSSAETQMRELLAALAELNDTELIFTYPNADTDGRYLIKMIEQFVGQHLNAHAYPSLGQVRYLSCMALVDGVVGNSSSGLTEVPSFKKGTINIGDRQRGRMKAPSVIDCSPARQDISNAIKQLYSSNFIESLGRVNNPYGNGGASQKIVFIIKSAPLQDLIKKRFYNINLL